MILRPNVTSDSSLKLVAVWILKLYQCSFYSLYTYERMREEKGDQQVGVLRETVWPLGLPARGRDISGFLDLTLRIMVLTTTQEGVWL